MALNLFTIPAIRSFADALAGGLIDRYGRSRDPLALARGLILLPNNRARRAVADAFVRASGGALLMPRLVSIGDPEAMEGAGALLDPADAEPIPPAVAPLHRRMVLARLVAEARAAAGAPVDAAEAARLAGELARTFDQLLLEEVAPAALRDLELAPELSRHWLRSLELFELLLDRWPAELARIGATDLVARRAALLERMTERWRHAPPAGFVCAAGVTDAAPAVARLLRRVAELPLGSVVFAGLGTDLDDEEWDALGPHEPDPTGGRAPRPSETHPQFHLKRLLDRMGVARGEVDDWPDRTGPRSTPARARAIASAFAPAELTRRWTELPAERRRLSGVAFAEFATAADEAQGIALALREELQSLGRTAALVTPDRALARRVAAHLQRWGVEADDTAGRPLSILPPGTLLTAIAEAAAQRFAPLALLSLVKHPLVRAGDARLAWLDGARALDRSLRGPRPAPGLEGVDAHLACADPRDGGARDTACRWWPEARAVLQPVADHFTGEPRPLHALAACLREAAQALAGDAAWSGPAGRAAAELLAELEAQPDGPREVDPANLSALLGVLMDEIAVRPPQGGHPRLAIYGLIEARLQSADLVVLGGLNEGAWPSAGPPDPWLAPRLRAELRLPGLDARVGVAAHDFAQGLGAPRVLVTRAKRDARAPALPSRFWLRLEALAGDRFERAGDLVGWVHALDAPQHGVRPASRPAPSVPASLRPREIAVTEVDRLKADPFAFYARRILRLSPLDAVDADPSAAWRGSAVHDVLERWARDEGCRPDRLRPLAAAMIADERTHPLVRALWWPRLAEGIDWTAAEMEALAQTGRSVLAVEGAGKASLAGVSLTGRFDRIDLLPGGGLGIVDYKTGKPPSARSVREGFSLQLGLLGHIAAAGGFEGVAGAPAAFEYWSLGKRGGSFGYRDTPCDPDGKRDKIVTAEFVDVARRAFKDAADRWLTGDEPFTAKLHPDYAPYGDYDQLMRQDEWYGRE